MKKTLLVLLLAWCAPVFAQSDYPKKPVKLVVGFPPGSISDVLARTITIPMSKQLGETMFVENRPGAASTTAGSYVARAEPDGYTLWLLDTTTHAINAHLYTKLPYESIKDFTYIAMVASTPLMLVVPPSIPAKSVQELFALLKASPGKYSYGSTGNGTSTHLSGALLKSAAGVEVVHVPYRSSPQALQAILGGEVAFFFSTMPAGISNLKAGRLRALAVTSPQRVTAAPEVPTMIEAGLRDFEMLLYSGVLGPQGMDRALVRRLNAEFARAVQAPESRQVYETIGADPIRISPEEFESATANAIAKFGPVVKASGAKVE